MDSTGKTVSFLTQANALLRKNLTFQKRKLRANIGLVVIPVLLCLLLMGIQSLVNEFANNQKQNCECNCDGEKDMNACKAKCAKQSFNIMIGESSTCPIPKPAKWPPLMQLPSSEFRAVRSSSSSNFSDLPDESCKETRSCPVTVLVTGANRSLAERLGQNLFKHDRKIHSVDNKDSDDLFRIAKEFTLGTDMDPSKTYFMEPAFLSPYPLQTVQPHCKPNFIHSVPFEIGGIPLQQEVQCVQGLYSWRDSSSAISTELFRGYQDGNSKHEINEFLAAYDFQNTNNHNFNVTVLHNGTYGNKLIRNQLPLNLVTNSYLQVLKGVGVKMVLEFLTEMPKPATMQRKLDISARMGPTLYSWVIQLLFPVMLTYLVYEKQQNLRIIMKMHGLGDGPYWMITYAYFLSISCAYMSCFVAFGTLIGLKSFTLNNYGVQFVFFFIFLNLQIALAFLMATFFSKVKTSTVMAYMYVFGSGLLGAFLFQNFIEDSLFPRHWVIVMELFPGFSLYRGLYEFGQSTFEVEYSGAPGLNWEDVKSNENGLKSVLIIMGTEWLILLLVAYYLDQVVSVGSGVKKHPLWFLQRMSKNYSHSLKKHSDQTEGDNVLVNVEKQDVSQEREVVEMLLREPSRSHAIICGNLKKVYPPKDGNPENYAVRGLSLALPRGECFGMLGPNGAGKTSFINMMTGLTNPTSGTALVNGFDIRTNMNNVYSSMGVCPQHDLIWESLTGREHLLFYGRLKNLKGYALMHAVKESLKSVNLYNGGVADKLSGTYSGGMKRRLSVAISLIGNPQVVYMDEPSTGLDPASRNNLWSVIQQAKQDKAIILTTHSMEEAEFLCNRIGIFVDGNLQCIGNPKQLKARYGGVYVLTMTTSFGQEEKVEQLALGLSPRANKIYNISGTQKFELPKQDVRVADVFSAVENAKKRFTIYAWGLTDTTLEDVFIKVAKGASS